MDDLNPSFGVAGTSPQNVDQLVRDPSMLVGRKFTAVSGSGLIQRGTVLGKITTGGKVTTALSASSDGSQTPYCIAAETRDATSADIQILCYTSGSFNGPCTGGLILGTGITIAALRDAFRALSIVIHENPVI